MTSTTTSATTAPALDDASVPLGNQSELADANPLSSGPPSRESVLSRSSTYAASVFTFNASWRPDSLNQPTFLDPRSRKLTDGSGSGSSGSSAAASDVKANVSDSKRTMEVHYEDAEEDRLSDASTYAEGQDGPFADPIAEYLAGYGFYDGLGYDVMPSDDFLDADDGQQYATVYPQTQPHRPFCSPSPTAIEHEFPAPNLPKTCVGSGWERAFMQKGVLEAMLGVMGIDERLRNDPLGVWEDMCWDVAAPETPVLPPEWDIPRGHETAERGIAADIRTDAHHDWDHAHAPLNARDNITIALRHGSQALSDGGVSTPQTARPRPNAASVLEHAGEEEEVFDISPTTPALVGVSDAQESRSPSEASGPETPCDSDERLAEAGAHAQGRRINRSPTSRPSSPLRQEMRPSSSISHEGGYASFAQAMVRQRRPVSTRTPPLRLSMVWRESVPMYGATDRDPLLLGNPPENPSHDPPPYEAGATTGNGQTETDSAVAAAVEPTRTPAVSPLPATPSTLPEEEERPSPQHRNPSPSSGSQPSNHSSVYSNKAVVGARNKASVPIPIPATPPFNVAASSALQTSIRTYSPTHPSRSTSPSAVGSATSRSQNGNLSPSSTVTPTSAWPHASASVVASGQGWNSSTTLPAAALGPNYVSSLFPTSNARDSLAQSPSRSEASARRSRPLPTAPGGLLAPGVTRVVPASWVSTSVPAQLNSPSGVNSVSTHGQGLPVKVSIEVTDQDAPGRSSGSGSDESGMGFTGYLKSKYSASKDNLSLASPTSTMSLRTPTKLSPLRRLENQDGSDYEGKTREKTMRDLSVNTSLAVGHGMKRFASRCGTISRKIVNGSVVR